MKVTVKKENRYAEILVGGVVIIVEANPREVFLRDGYFNEYCLYRFTRSTSYDTVDKRFDNAVEKIVAILENESAIYDGVEYKIVAEPMNLYFHFSNVIDRTNSKSFENLKNFMAEYIVHENELSENLVKDIVTFCHDGGEWTIDRDGTVIDTMVSDTYFNIFDDTIGNVKPNKGLNMVARTVYQEWYCEEVSHEVNTELYGLIYDTVQNDSIANGEYTDCIELYELFQDYSVDEIDTTVNSLVSDGILKMVPTSNGYSLYLKSGNHLNEEEETEEERAIDKIIKTLEGLKKFCQFDDQEEDLAEAIEIVKNSILKEA